MTNTKTLLLAAIAALTLGVGAARAQSLVPSSIEAAAFSRQTNTAQVPAGSSDRATSLFRQTIPAAQGHLEGGDGGAG